LAEACFLAQLCDARAHAWACRTSPHPQTGGNSSSI
jgi:hypothetical protein